MSTDVLEQIEHARWDTTVSPDAMRWRPPKPITEPHPLAIERLTNPGMAAIRVFAHQNGLDGYAAAAELRRQHARSIATLAERITYLFDELGRSLKTAIENAATGIAAFVNAIAPPTPKPQRGRARRYHAEMRQLKRRNWR